MSCISKITEFRSLVSTWCCGCPRCYAD